MAARPAHSPVLKASSIPAQLVAGILITVCQLLVQGIALDRTSGAKAPSRMHEIDG